MNNIVSKVWKIHWKVNIGKIIRGSDIISYSGKFDETTAEDILEKNALGLGTSNPLLLKNFADKYVNADHCLDWELVKIEQVKERIVLND